MSSAVKDPRGDPLFLIRASKDLASSLEFGTTLRRVADLAIKHLADWCVVHLVDPDLRVSDILVDHRDSSKIDLARDLERRYPYDPDSPYGVAQVLRTGRAELVSEISEQHLRAIARDEDHFRLLKEVGMTSAMVVPLVARGKPMGAISFVAAESGRVYGPEELGFAESLAELAALALDNARLYREAQREIAERRSSEQALAESEHRHRRLFEGALDAILLADDFGHYVDANPAACLLTGYSREELLRLGVWDLTPGGDRETIQALWNDFISSGTQAGEVRLLRKDGSVVEAEYRAVAHFVPRLHLSFLRDVGARKRAEAAFKEGEERFRHFIEGVKEYGLLVLDPAGMIATWNSGAERLKGYPAGEVIGRHFSLFYTEEDRDAGKPQRLLDKAGKEGHAKAEGWRLAKDGRRFWAEVLVTALFDPGGALQGFVKITRDTSDRRKLELELCAAREGLEKRVEERTAQLAEALREMETFTYTVAHDLRAPLRTIAGFSQLLNEEYGGQFSEGMGRLYLEQLASGARKMDSLISDLLAYSQVSRRDIEFAAVGLEGVVWEALDSLSLQVSESKAEVMVASPLPEVTGHRPTLVLVLTNLVSNAIKFVSPGTRPEIRIIPERRDDVVRLWVEDNGVGIDSKYNDRIFGMFERLHKAEDYAGTGMGLALVRRAVARMGGRCGVESEVGKGSRFWVELPQVPKTSSANPTNPSSPRLHETPPSSLGG